MNLFLRLFKTVLMAILGRKVNFMGSSVVRTRVWPHDLDHNLHLTNSKYFSIMDLGRCDLMIRSGHFKILRRKQWSEVVASVTIRFRFSLKLFDLCEVHTRLLGWDEKFLYMDHKILKEDQTSCHAVLKIAFLSQGGTVLPAVVAQEFGYKDASPILPHSILKLKETEKEMGEENRQY